MNSENNNLNNQNNMNISNNNGIPNNQPLNNVNNFNNSFNQNTEQNTNTNQQTTNYNNITGNINNQPNQFQNVQQPINNTTNNNLNNPNINNNQQLNQPPIYNIPNNVGNNGQNTNNLNVNVPKPKKNKLPILIGGIALISICLIFGLILLFNGNGNKKVSRTVMIYMVGSNLESEGGLATVDLNEISYNEKSEDVNVVLIAGGSKKWDNSFINVNETSIYELKANGFEKVKQQSLQNMGDGQVFSNFLNYVYDNYKTDKYDLIFWNHGGAILGSEFDELNNDDQLSLEEWEKALESSNFNKNNKLESVMFSTCLNGTLEVASIFNDYADYLVASEETTIGTALEGDLKFINKIKPTDDGYDVSLKFITEYKNKVNNYKDLYKAYMGESQYIYTTYSIVDLSKIDILINSVNDLFSDVDVNGNYNTIARVRSNLYQYAYTQSGESSYDMIDLYNLVDGIKDISPSKANKVLKNIENAVLYNYATNSSSRGISIYFPYNADTVYKNYFLGIYANLDEFKSYNTFINNFNNLQNTSYEHYSYLANKTNVNTTTDENYDFTLELTDEQKNGFAKAEYFVYRDNKDGYFKPVYKGNSVTLDGNTLRANIKDRQLKLISKSDSTGGIITLFEEMETDDYIKYNSVVVLEDLSPENVADWKMDGATISLIYDKKTKKTNVGSVILNSTNENLPSSVAVNLKDYTHIIFATSSYNILNDDGTYNEDWISNGVIEGEEEKIDNFDFVIHNFDDGYDYYCVFRIYDTNNNSYYSKLIKMN